MRTPNRRARYNAGSSRVVGGDGVGVDRELARLAVARLLEVRSRVGRVPESQVRQVAAVLGCSRASLYRWLAAGGLPDSERPRFALADEHLDAYFSACGSAAAAHRALAASGSEGLPSRRTFERAVQRDLSHAERARAREGVEGERRYGVYVPRPEPARNNTWETDHKQLNVLVSPRRGMRPAQPFLTAFVDTFSRAVMGYAISMVPDRGVVLAALSSALRCDAERGPFGGVPIQLRCDNGLEFTADALKQAAVAIGCEIVFTPPYMPFRKGKVERFHSTVISEFLLTLPFYTKGPRRVDGQLVAPNAAPMMLRAFVELFEAWVREYNLSRAHRGLGGQTPLERWLSDATPIRQPGEELLRRFLLAGESRPVTKRGVHFFAGYYVAAELNGKGGDEVEVRYTPNDHRSIEIYHRDRWLCTAVPAEKLSVEARERVLQARRDDAKRARRYERRARRHASVRLATLTAPGEVAETTVMQAVAGDRASQQSVAAERVEAELVDGLGLRKQPDAGGA